LKRLVQQDVALADRVEDILLFREFARHAGLEKRELQIRPVDLLRNLDQPHEVDRPIDLVKIIVRQTELQQQRLRHARRA
jgi:hypothetical protein